MHASSVDKTHDQKKSVDKTVDQKKSVDETMTKKVWIKQPKCQTIRSIY